MSRKMHRLLALVIVLGLALAGCGPAAEPTPTPAPTDASTPTPAGDASTPPAPTPAPTESPVTGGSEQAVRVLMLKGPTGMGSAKLMADNEAGLTAQRYEFTVEADPSAVPAKLVKGELDIAALPTNVAANLYNKSGDIQMLALNTLGVLYILENGDSVHSMADLAGKTLYATGQGANPEFVLNYLLEKSGLTPGESVEIVWKPSDELTALMGSGSIDLCMLPVPAATGVLMKNSAVRSALDLTAEWSRWTGDDSVLTMGCVVVRKAFAEENPGAVAAFLSEYESSIEYVRSNPEEAAELVARYEITPSAAIAKAAIPQANLVYVDGWEMPASIQGYYSVLWRADPTSIGGGIPDDGFYYVP